MNTEAKWDVFISYSTKDFAIIQKIVHDLQQRGISYWLDEEQINPGDLILDAIEQGLRDSRAIMPCFSKNQLQSGWSRAEYSTILNQFLSRQTDQKIYPLLLDDMTEDQLPAILRTIKCGRYTNQQSYAKLLNVLCRIAQQPEITEVSVPEAEVPCCIRRLLPQFIHDQYLQGNVEGNFEALTMFVDVSGFTEMTEKLMQHGTEGAEVLAEIMNKVFALLVQAVYDQKGFISLFAGDAFTAIFPTEDDGSSETIILHGLACIEKIQDILLHYVTHKTKFGQFTLGCKVGMSYGEVNWGIVGKTQKTYFFRGDAIQACAEAEHQAEKGDIIFDERLAQRLAKIPGVSGSDWKIERTETGAYRLLDIPQTFRERLPAPQPVRERPLRREILAQFLPESVLDFNAVGEFRPIVSVFIEFQGISLYEALNQWGALLLEQIANYGGYLCQFDFSDKGNTVFCVFGAPVGVEDPIERALACLLAVQGALKKSASLAGLEFRAGVAYGNGVCRSCGRRTALCVLLLQQGGQFVRPFDGARRLGRNSRSGRDFYENRTLLSERKGISHIKGFLRQSQRIACFAGNTASESEHFPRHWLAGSANCGSFIQALPPFLTGNLPGCSMCMAKPGSEKVISRRPCARNWSKLMMLTGFCAPLMKFSKSP